MPISSYKAIKCIRPKDSSTDFLDPIGHIFGENYILIEPADSYHDGTLDLLKQLEKTSLIVFLGHGTSSSLHSARSEGYEQKDFITKEHNQYFANHNVLFLACRSSDFILKLNGYRSIIGFGNIISSRAEISQEAEYTGKFRQLEDEEISLFNESYVFAIKNALDLLFAGKLQFRQLSKYISFFLNKAINKVLRDKSLKNRIELSRLLFELRNDMKQLNGEVE
ncbi:hypothetical protein [Sphingobacterium spiritivorum]|uniref:hypothetical protein n=1 Tax=Sphingobacterium spiritivorum TaxID=258 RepID=UPI00191B5B66|nr:hypothetical protein [Sphingobacterium spiritivorum]QQT24501.1 hypothetical protein I6J02_12115 [Sphingobacterium spiritivorum]